MRCPCFLSQTKAWAKAKGTDNGFRNMSEECLLVNKGISHIPALLSNTAASQGMWIKPLGNPCNMPAPKQDHPPSVPWLPEHGSCTIPG